MTDVARPPAALVLENGRVFRGRRLGAGGTVCAEVVFNTSMTGYQEIVSDPSYAGQMVVMTAVQIGNVGANPDDLETQRVVCAGLIMREASPLVASWRATTSLDAWLRASGVAGIDDLDTRALTTVLREQGAMRGAITDDVGAAPDPTDAAAVAADAAAIARVLERVRAAPKMDGLDLVPRVTCAARHEWTAGPWRAVDEGRLPPPPPADRSVVVYDFGVKENILRQLRQVGCRVIVVPATTPAAAVLAERPDGVLLSNGPGDPGAVTYGIEATRALVESGVPLFGICLGHQILGLALGARTYKLPFGHHGGNHPVKDLVTGEVEITAQNHGFAIDPASLPTGVRVSHVNLFDGTCAGIAVDGRPLFSVQYHPEASPGPHDASYLFRRFRDLIDAHVAARRS